MSPDVIGNAGCRPSPSRAAASLRASISANHLRHSLRHTAMARTPRPVRQRVTRCTHCVSRDAVALQAPEATGHYALASSFNGNAHVIVLRGGSLPTAVEPSPIASHARALGIGPPPSCRGQTIRYCRFDFPRLAVLAPLIQGRSLQG